MHVSKGGSWPPAEQKYVRPCKRPLSCKLCLTVLCVVSLIHAVLYCIKYSSTVFETYTIYVHAYLPYIYIEQLSKVAETDKAYTYILFGVCLFCVHVLAWMCKVLHV